MRRHRFSKYYVLEQIEGHPVLICKTSDLSDDELQMHFDLYLAAEDYEYCDEIRAEAQKRNLKLQITT